MTATVNTIASASSGRWSMPQSAMLPARLAGAIRSMPGGRVVPDRPGDRGLPGDEQGADAGRSPSGEPDGVGDHAGADEQRTDDGAVDRTARRPGRARTRKLGGDELADDRADQAEAEHHRPEALPDRREEHQLPRQRCQQHVTDVGDLHRDRAAVGAAAQAHGHRQHHGDAEDRRCLGEQHVDVDLVVDQPVDGVGHDRRRAVSPANANR